MADDRRDDLNFLGALGLLTVGALIGAGVALLLAPRTGEETREILREKGADWARRAQERSTEVARIAQERGAEWARRAQETVDGAQQKAQEVLGRGKEVVEERSAQLRAAFEAGRSAMRDEISKLRGKDEPLEGV
jgi:gas vesicle protein